MNKPRDVLARSLALCTFLALATASSSASADEPAAPVPATAAAPSSAAASSTTEPPSAAPVHHTVGPWILLGTGVALIATATVIEIIAVHEDDKRQTDEEKLTATTVPADKAVLQASVDSHDKSAKNGRTTGLIVGTVGFLSVAGAVIWWFLEGGYGSSPPPAHDPNGPSTASAKDSKTASSTKWLTPSFAPGYAGASFGASF